MGHVALHEAIARIVRHGPDIVEAAGVGQGVKVDNVNVRIVLQQVTNQVAADEEDRFASCGCAAQRIGESYEALWEHFEATNGPIGWMVLPLNSDEKLAATALSPERRARQTRRADYWIRTRKLLRQQIVGQLQRPGREANLSRVTQSLGPRTVSSESEWEDGIFDDSEDVVPSRVLETGPARLM